MADRTLIISVTGVVMSGIVGPTLTAWAARVTQRKQFLRDREGTRRDELLALCDEAATLLALGPVRLRQLREHKEAGTAPPEDLQLWAEQVYAVGQRFVLRLGPQDPLAVSYESVRDFLVDAGQVQMTEPDGQGHENAVLRFESARADFFAEAKRAMEAPVSENERQELTA